MLEISRSRCESSNLKASCTAGTCFTPSVNEEGSKELRDEKCVRLCEVARLPLRGFGFVPHAWRARIVTLEIIQQLQGRPLPVQEVWSECVRLECLPE